MPRRFVSEAIAPVEGSFDPAAMGRGEPGLPTAFTWKERTLTVHALLRTWRSTREDRGDVYLARHWFELDLEGGRRAVIYFERQARRKAPRWWLYTIDDYT